MDANGEGDATPGSAPSPLVTVAPFHKALTLLHLATSAGAARTECDRKMRPEDLWMPVADIGDVPVCRRCQGLPPLRWDEQPLFP